MLDNLESRVYNQTMMIETGQPFTTNGGIMKLEYTYEPSQVRVYSEGQNTLTDLEVALLDRIDELNLVVELQEES